MWEGGQEFYALLHINWTVQREGPITFYMTVSANS